MPRLETDEAFDAESDDTEHTPFPQPALTLFFLSGFLLIQRKVSIFYPENAQLPR